MQVLYNSLSNLHPYCRARICVSIEILIGNVGTGCLVSSGNLLPYITANWLLLHMVPQHSCWWDQGSDQSGSLCQAARAPGPWQGSLPAVQPPMCTSRGRQPRAAGGDASLANPTRFRGPDVATEVHRGMASISVMVPDVQKIIIFPMMSDS